VGGTGVDVGGTGVGVGGRGVGDGGSLTGAGDAARPAEIGISVVTSCIITPRTIRPTKQANKTPTTSPPPPTINHHLFPMCDLFLLESIRKPFASVTHSVNCWPMVLTTRIYYHILGQKSRIL
jgi:hypothetical protein